MRNFRRLFATSDGALSRSHLFPSFAHVLVACMLGVSYRWCLTPLVWFSVLACVVPAIRLNCMYIYMCPLARLVPKVWHMPMCFWGNIYIVGDAFSGGVCKRAVVPRMFWPTARNRNNLSWECRPQRYPHHSVALGWHLVYVMSTTSQRKHHGFRLVAMRKADAGRMRPYWPLACPSKPLRNGWKGPGRRHRAAGPNRALDASGTNS